PEAELLVDFGLTEGEPNTHPGQGTACRRFFFHNAYLELLWGQDPPEAQSELVKPTGLWAPGRCRSLGLSLRPKPARGKTAPLPGWAYRPPYLPDPLAIHVGLPSPLSEPMWCYLPFGRRPDDPRWPRRQPLAHPIGFREVARVRVES